MEGPLCYVYHAIQRRKAAKLVNLTQISLSWQGKHLAREDEN